MAVPPVSIEHVEPLTREFALRPDLIWTLSPARVGEYPALLRHVRAVLDSLVLAPEGCFDRLQAKTPNAGDMSFLGSLLVDHAEDVLGAIAVAARLDRKDVDDMLPDQALELLVKLLEVNVDFFVRALPMMQQLWARAAVALPSSKNSTGPTASSS